MISEMMSVENYKTMIFVVCEWYSSPLVSLRSCRKPVHLLIHSVSLVFQTCFWEGSMEPLLVLPLSGSF